MSELRDVIASIVSDREAGTLERCVNLLTGKTFYAEYEEVTALELLTDLGGDLREAAKLYVSDPVAAAALRAQQQIQINLFGRDHVFTVLRRENNPGNPQATFSLKYNPPAAGS